MMCLLWILALSWRIELLCYLCMLVPVHINDSSLLGIQWQGEILGDTRLLFGLCRLPSYSTQ